MKKSKQAGKYILSDFISASVAWLLFNILRYEVFAIDEGADSLLDYLQYPGVLGGQVVIPLFWLVLYYFSGYYNKPFGKSRLTELFSTFITVLIGTVFVFFALLLDDIPRSIDIYYKLFFGMFGLQFFITYIPRLLITQSGMEEDKEPGVGDEGADYRCGREGCPHRPTICIAWAMIFAALSRKTRGRRSRPTGIRCWGRWKIFRS